MTKPKKFFILFLFLLQSSILLASEAVSEYEAYNCEGYFKAQIPKQWSRKEKDHPYDFLTKVYGVKLTGPKNKDGAEVSISVLYYSGESAYKTAEEFINGEKNSMVRREPEKDVPAVDMMLAGISAKKIRIKTFKLVYLIKPFDDFPPDDGKVYERIPPYKQVTMIEEFIVAPAGKGFYVLNYTVPEDIEKEYRNVFEKVINSFEPQIK